MVGRWRGEQSGRRAPTKGLVTGNEGTLVKKDSQGNKEGPKAGMEEWIR